MGVIRPPVLRAEGLVRRYAARLALELEELQIGAGEVVAVLGPNGAGKSTLFRLLLLLEQPDAGRILIGGRPVRTGDLAAMRRMAGVFERAHLFTGTVAQNVAFGLRARGVARAERARRVGAALAAVGLERLAEAGVGSLSRGEAQRVALARAIVVEPELLLLDEPTAGLDVTVRRRFRDDLERVVRRGAASVVLITHDPADAFALADRIVVLDAGRVVQTGSPEDLVLSPATPFVAAFTGAELLLHGTVLEREDGLVRVALGGGVTVLAAAATAEARLEPGAAAHVAYRPEDVTLAPAGAPDTTSAQNRFRVEVCGVGPAGGLVRVRLEGEVLLVALVTRQSAEGLGVEPGKAMVAQLKASALRAFPG